MMKERKGLFNLTALMIAVLGMLFMFAQTATAYPTVDEGGCKECHSSSVVHVHRDFLSDCMNCHASIGDTPSTSKCTVCHPRGDTGSEQLHAKLPEGTVENLVKPENKATLAFILVNHVAPANYPIKQLKKEAKKGRKLYMASGKYLLVENKEGKIFVGGTEILKTVQVSNGWIHVIDDVLVPAE